MRPSDPPPPPADATYLAGLVGLAEQYGITHTGVAPATVMDRARDELLRRRSAGLHDGMAFTYKNPERSTDPTRAVRNAATVFVAARPYLLDREPPATSDDGGDPVPGRVARYARIDHYAPLREGLWAVARQLRRDGWKAVPFADDNSMVDREVAYRAGIGWFGKNANLLLPGAGSWFVLGSVVTTAPLPISSEPVADGCGPCRRCLDGCPTGAIVQPGVVDGAKCLAWLLQKPGIFDRRFRVALGDRLYGCDDCQEVCPPTVRLGQRFQHAAPDHTEAFVDVVSLLQADDAEVLRRWGRWYVTDRDPRWLRRNALVVLGNTVLGNTALRTTARPVDARVVAVVVRYLADDDPMLRAHAVWAARRLRLDHLLPDDDPHPDVVAELTAPL